MTNSPIPGDVVAQIDRVLDIPRETTQQTINWSRPALHALLSAHSCIKALQIQAETASSARRLALEALNAARPWVADIAKNDSGSDTRTMAAADLDQIDAAIRDIKGADDA